MSRVRGKLEFSEAIIKEAWERAGGKCECVRVSHAHPYGRCGKSLVWANRGRDWEGGWMPYCRDASAGDVVANCKIICSVCEMRL